MLFKSTEDYDRREGELLEDDLLNLHSIIPIH